MVPLEEDIADNFRSGEIELELDNPDTAQSLNIEGGSLNILGSDKQIIQTIDLKSIRSVDLADGSWEIQSSTAIHLILKNNKSQEYNIVLKDDKVVIYEEKTININGDSISFEQYCQERGILFLSRRSLRKKNGELCYFLENNKEGIPITELPSNLKFMVYGGRSRTSIVRDFGELLAEDKIKPDQLAVLDCGCRHEVYVESDNYGFKNTVGVKENGLNCGTIVTSQTIEFLNKSLDKLPTDKTRCNQSFLKSQFEELIGVVEESPEEPVL